jgi:hypothetical protein
LNPAPGKPSALPVLDFLDGGVDIVCVDSIDLRGDINLNGIAYEVADAVLFTNYFIHGTGVFTVNLQGQIAATDVNYDGDVLTIGDLVYLVRILTGEVEPIWKLPAYAQTAAVSTTVTHSGVAISVNSEADIGAARFVFRHYGCDIYEPELLNGASDMKLKYHDEDGVLTILVYSIERGVKIAAGAGNILLISMPGSCEIVLTETEISDYYGNMLAVSRREKPILPTSVALHQNYPNPFNSSTRIKYELPEPGHVRIEIFNVTGQHISTLVDRWEPAGVHAVEWSADNRSGDRVASGIYLYRITTCDFSDERKMLLIR